MQLKHYQQGSLERLRAYLEAARVYGARGAYERVQEWRYDSETYGAAVRSAPATPRQIKGPAAPPFQPLPDLEEVSYVCLRLPTGGGKTLLCAHTIGLAAEAYLEREFPLVLWLVPTTTIKRQTLETLQKPEHANARALAAAFGSRVRVFDIADFAQIRPQDIAGNACVVLGTFASLRVDNTEGRRAYDHHEELEGHFSRVSPNMPNLERRESDGGIKYSFVNLLHVQRPLVLVDEAHNAKSDLSFEVLRRVNPAAVIEYTATPAKNSNVIDSVTAAQLKAEEMIKLPIEFATHADWQAAVTASIQTRARLEQVAARDADYIRPLVLFQAENKGGTVTVEVLRAFLREQEGIPEEQIAVATGEQRELDGLNLFDPNCAVRYVITVQALKEGWDCSFAYVLCSVANTRSATAVEQLLGRVLRMPYAKSRTQPELNQAYAHVSAQTWPHAVSQLEDRLVNMGFEKQEVDTWVYQPTFSGWNEDGEASTGAANEAPAFSVRLTGAAPDLAALGLDLAEKGQVRVVQSAADECGAYVLEVTSGASEELVAKLAKGITDKKDRREFELVAQQAISQRAENRCAVQRGEPFVVPQLCLELEDGERVLLEKEECLGEAGFDPLASYTPLTKEEFRVDEAAEVYLADIEGEKVTIRFAGQGEQLELAGIVGPMDEVGLVANLARNLHADVGSETMAAGAFVGYLQRTVRDLLARGDMDWAKLVRSRFVLEKVLRGRLNRARQAAYGAAMQQVLFPLGQTQQASDGEATTSRQINRSATVRVVADLQTHGFRFPREYPAGRLYEGSRRFRKHYYPLIAQMNAEELACALELDKHDQVQYWVRNLERNWSHAFSLPTSSDWFYPDFVAQLHDGQLLVVEYKGAHLATNADTQEKAAIGQAWARLSGNRFLMASTQDDAGRNLAAQIEHELRRG